MMIDKELCFNGLKLSERKKGQLIPDMQILYFGIPKTDQRCVVY